MIFVRLRSAIGIHHAVQALRLASICLAARPWSSEQKSCLLFWIRSCGQQFAVTVKPYTFSFFMSLRISLLQIWYAR
jgi:hypothetical protein